MQPPNGKPVPQVQVEAVAAIQVVMTPDGKVAINVQCPGGRVQAFGMLEDARFQMYEHFRQVKKEGQIVVAQMVPPRMG